MSSTVSVGIDLGTTFCCVAVFHKGHIEVIKVRGHRTIPSTVFYHNSRPYVSIGYDAESEAPRCYANEIYDAKRLIGRKFADTYVTQLVTNGKYPFTVCPGEDGEATVEIQYEGATQRKKPEEISAELLKAFKEAASEYLGEEVKEVVVSVPAYFSNAQRKATRSAASLAGLEVLRFISEPVAAAVRYTYGQVVNKKLLVFDFGGGTLDVSVIDVAGRRHDVMAVYGDTALGGRDVDAVLMDHFIPLVGAADDPLLLRRLRKNCIKLKKSLSVVRPISEEIEQTFYYKDKDYSLLMSRQKFDELNRDIYNRSISVVEVCLFNANIEKNDIDEVILVGGSCRILRIQELLKEFFVDKPIRKDLDPDEIVAMGACIQAASIQNCGSSLDNGDLEGFSIGEVTPLSLGVSTYGKWMDVLIPRNSRVPILKSTTLSSSKNDQSTAHIEIFEGERAQTCLNNSLGEFTVRGLPKGKRGTVEVEITFSLDEDGILDISATETSTGTTETLVVTVGNFQLCDYHVIRSLKEAHDNQEEDRIFVQFVKLRNLIIGLCTDIQHESKDVPTESDREFLKSECEQLVAVAEIVHFRNKELLMVLFGFLCKKLKPYIKRNLAYLSDDVKNIMLIVADISNGDFASSIDSALRDVEGGNSDTK